MSSLAITMAAGAGLDLALPTSASADTPKRVLVVTVTKGFRHSSIPTAERVIGDLAKQSGVFTVEYARVEPTDSQFKGADGKPDTNKVDAAIVQVLAEKMSPGALKNYDAIIFANTTGVLPLPDKAAFLKAIEGGMGFVGMHSASDTFHNKDSVDPYIAMLGGEFQHHGNQVGVDCVVCDSAFPATKQLGKTWPIKQEEIYLLKNYDPATVHELLVLDKQPNDGTPGRYPVSWAKMFGKGKVFYTSLGHREDIWDTDPDLKDRINPVEVSEAYHQHILGGILWALGLQSGDVAPRKNAASP